MGKNELELFESEWAILQVVWEEEPCTAPDVQEALVDEKNWAYTTVKTMLSRLVAKVFPTKPKPAKPSHQNHPDWQSSRPSNERP